MSAFTETACGGHTGCLGSASWKSMWAEGSSEKLGPYDNRSPCATASAEAGGVVFLKNDILFAPEAKSVGWPDLKALPTNLFWMSVLHIHTHRPHTHSNIPIHVHECTDVITIYIYSCIFTHTYMHLYIHVHIHMHTYYSYTYSLPTILMCTLNIYTLICIYSHTYTTHIFTHRMQFTHIQTKSHVQTTHTYIHIHSHIHTHKPTHTLTIHTCTYRHLYIDSHEYRHTLILICTQFIHILSYSCTTYTQAESSSHICLCIHLNQYIFMHVHS
jgi:hypothetical protein